MTPRAQLNINKQHTLIGRKLCYPIHVRRMLSINARTWQARTDKTEASSFRKTGSFGIVVVFFVVVTVEPMIKKKKTFSFPCFPFSFFPFSFFLQKSGRCVTQPLSKRHGDSAFADGAGTVPLVSASHDHWMVRLWGWGLIPPGEGGGRGGREGD